MELRSWSLRWAQ
ncbi:hypothetical protein A2U01_0085544, partial [Trifolium medium]|nr:hypothetical protein [Trifolium medium]